MANNIKTLSDMVAESTGITKTAAYDFSRAFIKAMRDTLVLGEKITISDFGTFSVKDIPAMQRRNPQTGEMFMAEATAKVKFKTAPSLRNDLVE